MISSEEPASTRPYLIRALYEWCTDNGFTPYVAVLVDESVQVPMEYVRNGEIVLNISPDATSALKLGNELIEFKARFAGTARDIMVPVDRVLAIYARENGQGMAFPAPPVPRGEPAATLAQADASPLSPITAPALRPGPALGTAPATAHAAAARSGMQLVASADTAEPSSGSTVSASPKPAGDEGADAPEPPKPTGGRPALKRVK